MSLRTLLLAVALTGPGAAAHAADSAGCARTTTVYLPIETAVEPLGYRGLTRSEYLDRRYNAGRWTTGAGQFVRAQPPEAEAALTIAIEGRTGRGVESVDLIAEAQLAYLDAAGRPGTVHAHRPIASYSLNSEGENRISVPPAAFKEPGALLVVVTILAGGTRERQVVAIPVAMPECERRVYVEDRFMAIRLNRGSAR
jgi:hypothetical protein